MVHLEFLAITNSELIRHVVVACNKFEIKIRFVIVITILAPRVCARARVFVVRLSVRE
jgi:signal recognition particle receptor subunit beta